MQTSIADAAVGIVVFIPAALKRPSHTLYCICVKVDDAPIAEWTVNRRYSQFLELREKVLRFLERTQGCPGCANTALAIASFPFPPKAWFRTNKLVRQRVRDLQSFIQVLIGRAFSAKPKCNTCGAGLQNIVRPFFYRGAQPIHRHSSIVRRDADDDDLMLTQRTKNGGLDSDCSTMNSAKDMSYAVSKRRTRISKSLSDSKTLRQAKCSFIKESTCQQHDHESSYLDGASKCTDARPSVLDALKDVVIADGFANTKQEKMYRLSTMWETFELDDIQREMASGRATKAAGILI
ncbi:hypothetical protein SDRG_06239 [Saprolegnia diclina VS20]|uniref:PX domain-containing protein n=1 Tax=Saprolegnia diclina (strain VS20) TaxID=1156394 RepID=T0RUI9_SAPDV|nr:hypothetical protein SDRG_06239 [Saprolegnia diclina VS20]EQC36123.1 hypothetical protein SDRG_06239 [Saprolegnia diclina VS20]|eukprot:XP_008610229.1 hypothetical protein SDRG_06239 [Saprolegnia diclina VS20]